MSLFEIKVPEGMEQADLEERFALAGDRLKELECDRMPEAYREYFGSTARFLEVLANQWEFLKNGGLEKAPLKELEKRNQDLYRDVVPENYETSYVNPAYAVKMLGENMGTLLAAVFCELRQAISAIHEGNLAGLVERQELLLQIYGDFEESAREKSGEGKTGQEVLPAYEQIRGIFAQYKYDYCGERQLDGVEAMALPEDSQASRIIRNADLRDARYLYAYGNYITENEKTLVQFMNDLPEETIATMADTFTEGYRIGFEMTGKDLSKKKLAELVYPVGFERMMRRAVENLAKLHLSPVTREERITSTHANRQYGFDHKDDDALFMDPGFVDHFLEVRKEAFEKYKTELRGYAGPAVVESFGEKNFDPVNKKEAAHKTPEQNKLYVEWLTKFGMLNREYIIEEERSFTIIAFPIPEITSSLPNPTPEGYGEFFREIIRVNTLDYMKYRNIQATIIESLDQADYCEIKGMKGNHTDLKVNLWKLKDPARETIFENCVADVNIPVGEVFTSPVLEGTNGTLHVTRVYLEGLEYRNLEIRFKEGMIDSYTCSNFEKEEENKAFVYENVLHRHETIPMGEFAIGTNTTAYVVARKYGVEDKLPILIAEKTGPHFAVGDTCYSHAEEIRVYNPDKKEIVAKDNSRSLLRDTDMSAAYFNCHTDITIPYEELGELTAVKKDGTRIEILKNGRFVLPGTEELNKPLEEEAN